VAAATLPGADAIKAPWTEADIHFMSGMIPHHAQAVAMCQLAPTNGASEPVRILCERIIVGQGDEIALMQSWLHDRGQKVPPADATHLRMTMDGVEHDMLMPGMMTPEEMAQLKAARGREFDRLWLLGMIKHHQGAITMVEALFANNGAGQDEVVFRFASDVFADQTTEIERMQRMLEALNAGGSNRDR
jgi:uncharacterized protein (DUF305 family)